MTSDQQEPIETLLVLDDEPDILDAIRRLLRKRYRVLTAQSADEATRILATEEVQVVLADQRLPQRSGVEFFSDIRKSHPSLVRVLFTGYANIEDVIRAINEGHVYRYISKPWKPAELQIFIDQAFDHWRVQRERGQLIAALETANVALRSKNEALEQANANLKLVDRVKSVFMEVASHELNTPIAILLGYTFLLRRELGDDIDPISTKALERIEASSQRLKRIADRIFQMMSQDGPAATLRPQKIELREFATSLHEQVEPFLERRKQKLICLIEDGCDSLEADSEKLLDVFTHLIMNAIKFSPDGESITLRIHQPEHANPETHIALTVQDNGIGIDPEDADQIFQAFFSTFKSVHHSSGEFEFGKRGIGLGLAVARRFVEMHRGTIEATPRPVPSRGAAFTVTLPRLQRQSTTPAPAAP
jgi:signal transduction histidine kinase